MEGAKATLRINASSIRVCPLELTQQLVAALDCGIQRRFRGFPGAERLLQFVLDCVANQHEGTEPDSTRVLGGWLQRDLLDRKRSARIAIIEPLGTSLFERRAGDRQISCMLVPGGLDL